MAAKGWQKIKGEWKKLRPAKRRRTLSETPLDVKIARANTRIKALEKAGLADKSPAYRNLQGTAKAYEKYKLNVFNNYVTDAVRFKTGTKRMTDEERKRIEIEVESFLSASTSKVSTTRKREKTKEEAYNRYQASFDSLIANRKKKEGALKRTNKKYLEWSKMTYEQWEQIWDSALTTKIMEHFSSSQAVDIAYAMQKGKTNEILVQRYLETLSDGEQGDMRKLNIWSNSKTPNSKKIRV